MLYEFAIMPELFDASTISGDKRAEVILPQILNGMLKNGGLLANLNKDKWQGHVEERVGTLVSDFPDLRDRILTLIRTLDDRHRLIRHPKSKRGGPSTDQDWLNVTLDSHEETRFHAIILSQALKDGCTCGCDVFVEFFNCLNSKRWNDCRRTLSVRKTLDDYKRYLARVLRYAKRLVLIDPYLSPEKEYLDTIEICSEMLGQRRESQGRLANCSIHIHAEEDSGFRHEYGTKHETVEDYLNSWEKRLHPLIEEYGHSFRVLVWKSGSNSMHDRFILTDQCGISVPWGLDCPKKPKKDANTDWGLLDEETRRKRWEQYDPDIKPKLLLRDRKFPGD